MAVDVGIEAAESKTEAPEWFTVFKVAINGAKERRQARNLENADRLLITLQEVLKGSNGAWYGIEINGGAVEASLIESLGGKLSIKTKSADGSEATYIVARHDHGGRLHLEEAYRHFDDNSKPILTWHKDTRLRNENTLTSKDILGEVRFAQRVFSSFPVSTRA